MHNNELSTKVDTTYKQIISLSAPIWLSILITQINFFTNTYFLGHAGKSELAANAIGGIFYMIIAMVCYGFNNGVQVVLSRRAGQEDKKGFGEIYSHSISLGLLFCAIIVVLSYLIGPFLFAKQLHDEFVIQLATQFIVIRLFGLPFYFLEQMGNQFFIATKNTKYIIIGMLASTFINIIFDYLLINGYYGFPKLGIKGAAIASIFSEIVFTSVSFGIIYYKKLNEIFYIKFLVPIKKQLSIDTITLASPVILQYFFSIGSWLVFFIYVEHLGKTQLAVSQLLRSIFGIVGAASWALAATCNTMVSNLMGQKRYDDIFKVVKKITLLSFCVSLFLGIIYLLFPYQLMQIYSDDIEIIREAIGPLKVIVVANFLLAIATVVLNAVLGTGNTRTNLLIEFIAIFIYLTYIYFIIEKWRWSLSWAWGSEFFYWTAILAMSWSYLVWGKWREKEI